MNSQEKFDFWMTNDYFDEQTKNELAEIKGDSKEIEERFYRDLEFGTGGLRGIIGAGTNRMNKYIVRKASKGLSDYMKQADPNAKERGVVIAYDSRNFSKEFASEAARVFCENGIKTYLFEGLRTVPQLSFALRHLGAFSGVNITASHNPKKYNGYKVYGPDGSQITLDAAEKILDFIKKQDDITKIEVADIDESIKTGLLEMIGKEVDDAYIESLKTLTLNQDIIKEHAKDLKIVYTPIHGSANVPVIRVLSELGFENVSVVKQQEEPDGNFPTVEYPNPEEKSVFKLALDIAKDNNADLIIGTDPDGDRMGVLVKQPSGDYEVLTGNQIGVLLLEYIIKSKHKNKTMPKNPFVAKTIVTTELARNIANVNNVELVEVLTGFKFIGEQILIRQDRGDMNYLFGFEESYGYLAGTFARDKDAVVSTMLISELAAYYKAEGKNLYDGLMEIYEKYGYYKEDINTYTLEGKVGLEKIKEIMKTLRREKDVKFGSFDVFAIRDYKQGRRFDLAKDIEENLDLPISDVLYYELSGDDWFCVRPSGTEPKLKIYYGVYEKSLDGAKDKLEGLKQCVLEKINKLLEGSKIF